MWAVSSWDLQQLGASAARAQGPGEAASRGPCGAVARSRARASSCRAAGRGAGRGAEHGAWPSVSVLPLLAHLLVLPSRAPQEARVGGCCHTLRHAGRGAGLQSAEHILPGLGPDPMASGDLRRRS